MNILPEIKYFNSSKSNIIEDDFIIFSWETENALSCKIEINNGYTTNVFSNLPVIRQKKFKITRFKENVDAKLIIASNSNQITTKNITINRKIHHEETNSDNSYYEIPCENKSNNSKVTKRNLPLTIIGAIAVPLILLFIAIDIIDSLKYSDPYGSSVMFGWIIYITIIAVFEYYWLNR